ncbi:MAG TPA: SOS response-associated peptidase [Clostridia bacterium]|nr:SOS response-associated peptidase [Clostridia bacterium]
MCGRFLLDTEIREIIRTYKIQKNRNTDYKSGEIFPSTNAPIVFEDGERTIASAKWGFPYGFKKGIVINARSETIMQRPMFKNSFYTARCVIPANLYYEWKDEGGKRKVRHGIGVHDMDLISLGGIYKVSLDENGLMEQMTFVIITAKADTAIRSIHNRMPLIIGDRDIEPWLDKGADIKYIEDILKPKMDYSFSIRRFEDKSAEDRDNEDHQQLKMF